MFDKRTILTLLLACLMTAASYFYAPNAVCKFATNCNAGINPTTLHGFPLAFLKIGLFSTSTLLDSLIWQNLALDLLFYVLVILIIVALVKVVRH